MNELNAGGKQPGLGTRLNPPAPGLRLRLEQRGSLGSRGWSNRAGAMGFAGIQTPEAVAAPLGLGGGRSCERVRG